MWHATPVSKITVYQEIAVSLLLQQISHVEMVLPKLQRAVTMEIKIASTDVIAIVKFKIITHVIHHLQFAILFHLILQLLSSQSLPPPINLQLHTNCYQQLPIYTVPSIGVTLFPSKVLFISLSYQPIMMFLRENFHSHIHIYKILLMLFYYLRLLFPIQNLFKMFKKHLFNQTLHNKTKIFLLTLILSLTMPLPI